MFDSTAVTDARTRGTAMDSAPGRADRILAQMTLEEKVAQLVGFWVDQGDETVAPMAGEMATSHRYEESVVHGLGHLTRVYGTRPVDPVERAQWLWAEQRRLRSETRLGIPALVHEECLTGLATWKAATFPTPLAWGAAFDPDLIERAAESIGASMRALGIHQGLAPVLDVIRDPRWGRVDECIGEDPYLVGTVGTAYVRGLQSTGVHATLKHFVGYSASQSGRNHAPVSMGPRELEDTMLPPFEMAVRTGGVRSVMNSYAAVDGVPVAATPHYLESVLRDRWGFDGVVVSDYFSVAFLHTMHAVAADLGEAAELALRAGIDVELPTGDAFVGPLLERVRSGRTPEWLIDRAVLRVLRQKEELGLLDETFDTPPAHIDLDSPAHRELARSIAVESAVLLTNDGILPLDTAPSRIAVIGPNADAAEALMGCYSFANHVLPHHPGVELGFDVPTVLDRVRTEFADAAISFDKGCEVEGDDTSGFEAAVAAARDADVAIAVVGDRAGLFGRGTVGEGNDVDDLELPGVQRQLVEAVATTGTPVVLVVLSGRPYVLGWAVDGENAPAAVLQTFFPGEEGAEAIVAILSGREAPSGRLPVSLPRSSGSQPYSYLHPLLGGPNEITSADNTPALPFGHGLTYTTFERSVEAPAEARAGERITAEVRVRNTGSREGTDVVQLYGRDVFASVTRPLAQLLAYHRVTLAPGQEAVISFDLSTARFAFTDLDRRRIVQPGEIQLWVGPSCSEKESSVSLEITGETVEADDAVFRPVPATVAIGPLD